METHNKKRAETHNKKRAKTHNKKRAKTHIKKRAVFRARSIPGHGTRRARGDRPQIQLEQRQQHRGGARCRGAEMSIFYSFCTVYLVLHTKHLSRQARYKDAGNVETSETFLQANALPAEHRLGFLVFLEDFVSSTTTTTTTTTTASHETKGRLEIGLAKGGSGGGGHAEAEGGGGAVFSPEALEGLRAECIKYSTPEVQLIPGYTIDSNLGNRMMFIGPTVRRFAKTSSR